MVASIKPSVVNTIQYSLPEHIRVRNPKLLKFLEFYYQFLEESGNPLDFTKHILDLKDLDSDSNIYNTRIMQQMLSLIPQTSTADPRLIIKNLDMFLRSKGSSESFEFIMKALFDEDASVEYQSPNVLTPSSNQFTKDTICTIRSDYDFSQAVGTFLMQESTRASALIESANKLTINGNQYYELYISGLVGEFDVGATAKALKRTINRNYVVIDEYYELINLVPTYQTPNTHVLSVRTKVPLVSSNVKGLIVDQIDTTFAATINSLVGAYNDNLWYYYQFTLTDVVNADTATTTNEIYFIPTELVGKVITKTDYVYGIIEPSISNVDLVSRGSLYKESLPFHVRTSGAGSTGAGVISSIDPGSVDHLDILYGGFGYSVGDKVSTIAATGDQPINIDAQVSAIDGYGEVIVPTMELDTITILSAGSGYAVNDKLYVPEEPSIILQVTAITSTGGISTIVPYDRGSFYDCPPWFQITPKSYGLGTGAIISIAFRVKSLTIENAGKHFVNTDVIIDSTIGEGASFRTNIVDGALSTFTISNQGSGYTSATAFVVANNGSSSSITPTISAGKITGFTINDAGYNYVVGDSVVVVGNGSGFAGTVASVKNGVIRSVAVASPGANYNQNTTLTLSSGTGGSIVPVIDNGKIIDVTVVSGGYNYSASETIVVGGSTMATATATIGSGTGKIISINMDSGGTGYWDPSEKTPTKVVVGNDAGKGAVLSPVIENGQVVFINVVNAGIGYDSDGVSYFLQEDGSLLFTEVGYVITDTLSYLPTDIYISGQGSGATAVPRIGLNGEILHVDVVNPGSGYYMGTQVLVNGNGSGCLATPIVETGIDSVDVINYAVNMYLVQEDGFKLLDEFEEYLYYPQEFFDKTVPLYQQLLLEDGYMLMTESDDYLGGEDKRPFSYNIADDLQQEDGSFLYSEAWESLITEGSQQVTITVTDPTGTGAILVPNVNMETGNIDSVDVVAKGSGYTNPTYSIFPDYGYYAAVLQLHTPRYVKAITINSNGLSYDSANIIIQGEGTGAKASAVVEGDGSLTGITLNTQGSGYTGTPTVTVVDNSGYGQVSEITIANGGSFKKLPYVYLEDKYNLAGTTKIAGGAQLLARSNTIGAIRQAKITKASFAGDTTPWASFPIVAGVYDSSFIVGEDVTLKYKSYHLNLDLLNEDDSKILVDLPDTLDHLDTESGLRLICEEPGTDTGMLQQDDPEDFNFYGKIVDIDYPQRLLYIAFNDTNASDFFSIIAEDGRSIVDETNLNMAYENSAGIQVGDTLVGSISKSESVVTYLNRASGQPVLGGSVDLNQKFANDSGKLNNKKIKVIDSKKVQNFAYIIRSGLSKNVYENVLKKTVHPAGYAMFGDVDIEMNSTLDSPNGLTPQQAQALRNAMITLIFSLLSDEMMQQKASWYLPKNWVLYNKFAINSWSTMKWNLSTNVSDFLTTESGDYLMDIQDFSVGGGGVGMFGSMKISDTTSRTRMSWKTDSSMVITIINNR